MQVVLHLGAHKTDEDRLVKSLLMNSRVLKRHGVAMPDPDNYRKVIRALLRAADNTEITEGARDVVMDSVELSADPERLILSGPSFIGTSTMVVGEDRLYPSAEARLARFYQIFPHDQHELFIGIRNPATFLPAVYELSRLPSMADFLSGTTPEKLRWSDMIQRLRDSFPDLPITVWCNEDTPLIWAEILREMGGLDPTAAVRAEYALLKEIMIAPGLKRFQAYMKSHPGMTEVQKRRVISAFLDKFADEDAIEEELNAPGWTEEKIDQLSEIYDDDMLTIRRIPGVNMIAP